MADPMAITMTGYVEDPVSIDGFKEYWDMFEDYQIDEAFPKFSSTYLKSCKYNPEDKINFLDEFADKPEKDLQALEVQIQSHCS